MPHNPTSETSSSTRRPPANPDRRKAQNRKASQRRASSLVKSVISKLPEHQRSAVSDLSLRASTTTKRSDEALAFASNPISFTVDKKGKLRAPRPLGTARHEVAHFTIPAVNQRVNTLDFEHKVIEDSGVASSSRGLARAPALARRLQGGRAIVRRAPPPKNPLIGKISGANSFRSKQRSISPGSLSRGIKQNKIIERRLSKRGIDF